MLHTSFLTVFYSHALLAVYQYWDPSELTIEQLYDDVLWSSPVRSTPERIKRMSLEIRLRDKEEFLKKEININDGLKNTIKGHQSAVKRWVLSLITIGASSLFFLAIAQLSGVVNISIAIPNKPNLWAYLAIPLVVIPLSATISWNYKKVLRGS